MFDRATFYAALRTGALFDHGLTQRQVVGIEAILDAWDKSGYSDDRWLAYILATTYHETARAMYPVPEGGRGQGHPYGIAALNGQVYYGRGFVQLTWLENYQKADKILALSGTLVANADLALDPTVAAQILIRGMAEAWFTAFKLSDYLNGTLSDYLHARKIVNGIDEAPKIASYALVFVAAITAAERKASDHTVAVTVKQPAPPVAVAAPSPLPAPAPAGDPLSQIADTLGSAIQSIPDAIGAAIPTSSPSPAGPAFSPATTESSMMNPLVLIPILEQVITYAPQVEGVLSKIPDIIAKGQDMIAKIKLLDAPDAIVDFEAIVADLGLNATLMASIIKTATGTAPPVAKAA